MVAMIDCVIVGACCFGMGWVVCALLASGKANAAYMDGFSDCDQLLQRNVRRQLADELKAELELMKEKDGNI